MCLNLCIRTAASLLIAVAFAAGHAAEPDNEALLSRLRSDVPYTRVTAARDAARLAPGNPAILTELGKLLNDRDFKVRASAVEAYVALGGDADAASRLLSDRFASVREAALQALLERDGDLELARRMMSDADQNVRLTAVNMFLAQDGNPDLIADMLSDPDELIRESAFDGLQEKRRDPSLARRMLSDPAPVVRSAAVKSFLKLGGDREVLAPLLSDSEAIVRQAVATGFVIDGVYLDQAVETLVRLDSERTDGFVEIELLFQGLSGERAVQVATLLVEVIATPNADALLQTASDRLLEFDGLRAEHVPRLLQTLNSERLQARRAASRALAELARDCQLATPPLLAALADADWEVRVYAAVALLHNGNERSAAESCLRSALNKGDADVWLIATRGLERFPDSCANLVPELIERLGIRNDSQSYATDALSHLAASAVVPQLVATLASQDGLGTRPVFREGAAQLLEKYGPAARDAIPAVIDLSKDERLEVQLAAATALGAVGVQDSEANARLRAMLDSVDADLQLRVTAAESMFKCAGEVEALQAHTRETLRKHLQDPSSRVRAKCAELLVGLHEDPAVVIPVLEPLLTDSDLEAVRSSANALKSLGHRAAAAIPALIRMLASNSGLPPSWSLASDVLVAIGPASVPALIAALDDREVRVRIHAIRTLGGIGPQADAAVSALTRALDDSTTIEESVTWCVGTRVSVQGEAIVALSKIGPAAATAMPRIVELLGEEDIWMHYFEVIRPTSDAIGGFGDAAQRAYPVFSALADSDDGWVSHVALHALATIRPNDPRVLPHLEQELSPPMVGDEEKDYDNTLFEDCERLGALAVMLVPTLEHLVNDVPVLDPHVRVRAAAALVRSDRTNDVGIQYLRRRAVFEARDKSRLIYSTARETRDKLTADGVIGPE